MLIMTILRVLGQVLLGILLVLLLFLLYLLCSPICYQMQAQYEEDAPGVIGGSLTGLMRFVQFRVSYSQNRLKWSLSLFWGKYQILPKKKPAGHLSEEAAARQEKQNAREAEQELQKGAKEAEQEMFDAATEPVARDGQKSGHCQKDGKDTPPPKKREQKTGFSLDSLAGFRDNINNPEFWEAISFLWKKAVWLLQKIGPKHVSCDCSFSLGDPSWTGRFTGLISLCPACYGKDVKILPDFVSEDIFFRGRILIKGRIFLLHILYAAITVFLHENCRKLFHIS